MIERRQRAEGAKDIRVSACRQKDQLQGDSNPPAIEDRQIEDFGGGIKPNKFEGKKDNQPSAFCPTTSAFQGFRLGNDSFTQMVKAPDQT